MKQQGLMLAAAVIGGLVGGAVASRLALGTAAVCAQPPTVPEKVVRAGQVEVLDTAGKARLTLGLEHEGLAVLRFLNQEQVARIGLSLGAGGGPASLSFLDSGGKIRAMLALGSEGGPVLTFLDEAGQRIWRAPEQ